MCVYDARPCAGGGTAGRRGDGRERRRRRRRQPDGQLLRVVVVDGRWMVSAGELRGFSVWRVGKNACGRVFSPPRAWFGGLRYGGAAATCPSAASATPVGETAKSVVARTQRTQPPPLQRVIYCNLFAFVGVERACVQMTTVFARSVRSPISHVSSLILGMCELQ